MPKAEDESQGEANSLSPPTGARLPSKKEGWTPSRESTLVFAAGLLIGCFIITGFAARFYNETQRSLARRWYARGEAALTAGNAAEAIGDIRTALVYSRENGDKSSASDAYEFSLAKALAAQGKIEEARAYLTAAAERMPGNAAVSLELARLAARQGNIEEASRYYNAAIFGAWESNAASDQRRAARVEYFEFLLSHGEKPEAQAQAIAIAGALPPDAALCAQAGDMLLRSGVNDQALAAFQRSLSLKRTPAAARGAGVAAFRLANYREAQRFLSDAVRMHAPESDVRDLLNLSDQVLALDPFIAGLTVTQRAERASRDFAYVQERLTACAGSKEQAGDGTAPAPGGPNAGLLQLLKKSEPLSSEAHLKTHPDDLNSVMAAVFSVENGLTQSCGPPQGPNSAIQLIAKNRAGAIQP